MNQLFFTSLQEEVEAVYKKYEVPITAPHENVCGLVLIGDTWYKEAVLKEVSKVQQKWGYIPRHHK